MDRQVRTGEGGHKEHPKLEAPKLALHTIQFQYVRGDCALTIGPLVRRTRMKIEKELEKMPVDLIPNSQGNGWIAQSRPNGGWTLEANGGRMFGRRLDKRWTHVLFMQGATAPRRMHAVSCRRGRTKKRFCLHFYSLFRIIVKLKSKYASLLLNECRLLTHH